MNATKIEAIANADAHTNDAGLPTYSELLAILRHLTHPAADDSDIESALDAVRRADGAEAVDQRVRDWDATQRAATAADAVSASGGNWLGAYLDNL